MNKLDMFDKADKIVARILADVTDRRGWRQEWDEFDEDILDLMTISQNFKNATFCVFRLAIVR